MHGKEVANAWGQASFQKHHRRGGARRLASALTQMIRAYTFASAAARIASRHRPVLSLAKCIGEKATLHGVSSRCLSPLGNVYRKAEKLL
jgi:hypothetical protein